MILKLMHFITDTFLQEASLRRNPADIEVGLLRAGLARVALVGVCATVEESELDNIELRGEAAASQAATAIGVLNEYISQIDMVISRLKAAAGSASTSGQDQLVTHKIKALIARSNVRPLMYRLMAAFSTLGLTEANLRIEMLWNAYKKKPDGFGALPQYQIDTWRVVASSRNIHTKPDADLLAAKARAGGVMVGMNDDRLWDGIAAEQHVLSCLDELWKVAAPLPEAKDAE